ncbi:hypothetical protein GWI33_018514 [Rhynchophorus ferrugineus]|uniref:Uncharacterized protein n=1 Tax=Rhynchophorus ferrugineus TaxID=354439 RepID=A0A834M687_RHYFE|nr:hypothetical protein GWI33_018514 [Rhynchophorus ferrugineus]
MSHSKQAEDGFEKCKNRFNLHNLKMKGEGASDEAASKEYRNLLKGIIARGGCKLEQVFLINNILLENDPDVQCKLLLL